MLLALCEHHLCGEAVLFFSKATLAGVRGGSGQRTGGGGGGGGEGGDGGGAGSAAKRRWAGMRSSMGTLNRLQAGKRRGVGGAGGGSAVGDVGAAVARLSKDNLVREGRCRSRTGAGAGAGDRGRHRGVGGEEGRNRVDRRWECEARGHAGQDQGRRRASFVSTCNCPIL